MDSDDRVPYTFTDDYNFLVKGIKSLRQKKYVILNQNDLIKCQELDITNVTTVLSISKHSACMLLLHYKWNMQKLLEAWFDDEAKVRMRAGLLDVDPAVKFPVTELTTVDCGICFESVTKIDTATCGFDHWFCKTCWEAYICMAIDNGPGCLTLRCPGPFCDSAVGPDMVNKLVTEKDAKRYGDFMVRYYVQSSYNIKWCPGPGCGCAVLFDDDFESGGGYDVSCVCKHAFCWKCMEDAHRPLSCETVAKWMVKTTSDAENMNWILAYTKPCPNCKRPIEKIDGCMHMTCIPPCGYEFCWSCLDPYKERNCTNVFEIFSEEQKRVKAKNAIKRYTYYYERWDANERSRKEALLVLNKIELGRDSKLWIVKDAWTQIVECRRVLKWTYVYGYYMPNIEHAKRSFLEYAQGEAEMVLERLRICAETGLERLHIEEKANEIEFYWFRSRLASLTSVTRSYFENLVRSLENGLSEIADESSGCGQDE